MIRLQVLYPLPYPLPLHRLSSLPLLSLLPLAHPLVHKALRGFVLPLLMSAVGLAQMALSPQPPTPQSPKYLLACLSVFLSFGLAVRSRISPIPRSCALTISSHLQTQQGYDEPYFNMGGMDRLCSEELNELRQPERRHLSLPSQIPSSPKITPPLAWSNSPEGAFCKTTMVISIDRGSLKSS